MIERAPLGIRLQDAWRNFWLRLGNRSRRPRPDAPPQYVVLNLSGPMPEYIPPQPWWYRYVAALGLPAQSGGPSLTGLRAQLERIAADPATAGVVLRLEQFQPAGWATACSLRDALLRFRKSGKQAIAYADEFSNASYFVAAAASEIALPPGGGWNVFGLQAEVTFLKEALDSVGVEAEVLKIAPYKTAGDMFNRSNMSREHREMLDWILDGHYAEFVSAIAAGRTMEPERVRALIDTAPRLSAAALEAGLVDLVCYLDELPRRLAAQGQPGAVAPERSRPATRDAAQKSWLQRTFDRLFRRSVKDEESAEPLAKLLAWEEANRRVPHLLRWRSGRQIGVVSLEGTIASGASRRLPVPFPLPFIGQAVEGSETVSQALRQVEKDDNVVAVVFYVDSRGGSAIDSSLIWREVERLRRKKPVVVYMANAAASGGYYVAAGADWIVAQPLTVTGSIGVVMMKFVTAKLFKRLRVKSVRLQRGERAGVLSSSEPFDHKSRRAMQDMLEELYGQFKQVVAAGRKLDESRIDEIAGGRVWLGKQALDLRLVDQLGDLTVAIDKARALANTPISLWTPAVWIRAGRGGLLPPPFPASNFLDTASALLKAARSGAWMIAPFDVDIH